MGDIVVIVSEKEGLSKVLIDFDSLEACMEHAKLCNAGTVPSLQGIYAMQKKDNPNKYELYLKLNHGKKFSR